jgi:hypothetical protein
VGVVAASLGFQWWVLRGGVLGGVLETAPLTNAEFGALLALGAIPLAGIEIVKGWRRARS